MALNFTCVSVFLDTEEARVVSLGPLKLHKEAAGKGEIFDLDVPFPYLVETVPPPWFSHTQILKTGVGQGLGTSSSDIYLLLLEGIELVSFYNKEIVGRPDGTTNYVDDALNVKRLILKLASLKKNPSFPTLRARGVIWASQGFEFLLCGALDEAYAVSAIEEIEKKREIDISEIKQVLAPIVWYNKVHSLFNLRQLPFRDTCERNAMFACYLFALRHKHAPWRDRRETKHDAETAAVLETLGKQLSALPQFSESVKHLCEAASLFVNMVKINSTVPRVDITGSLYEWADKVGVAASPVSKAALFFSQP